MWERFCDGGAQNVEAFTGVRGDCHGAGVAAHEAGDGIGFGDVGLVDDDEFGHGGVDDIGENVVNGCDLPFRVRVRTVDHVEQNIGLPGLFQAGAERFNQLVRQIAHEADRVGQGVGAAVFGLGGADGRVERGEQDVLHHDPGVRQPVEQARLASVGVADDRDRRDAVAFAGGAFDLAGRRHLGDVAAQLRHALADAATVEFDLGFTGTARTDSGTAGHLTTGLTRHGFTPAAQTRQQVLQLCEFDLCLAFATFGVLGEDVEDERHPVDDLHLDDVFQCTALGRCEFGVEDDGVSADGIYDFGEFACLAAA